MKFRRSSLPAYVCLVHVFKLFFNRQVVHLFVEQTKLNYEWKKEGCTTCQTQDHVVPHDHPRDKCSYLSPLPWVLIVQLPKMCDYWRQKQWLFHLPVFAEVMRGTGSSRPTTTSTCQMTLKPYPGATTTTILSSRFATWIRCCRHVSGTCTILHKSCRSTRSWFHSNFSIIM